MQGHHEPLPVDIDVEPELSIADLRVATVSRTGRILRWHVLVRKDFTVMEFVRKLVERSQPTDSPLQPGCVVLAEVLHSRLHRIIDPGTRIGRLNADESLVLYEVPLLGGSAQPTQLQGVDPPSEPDPSEYHTIVCHPRFAKTDSGFFADEDATDRELVGIPLMIRVRTGVTHRRLYELLAERFYGARRAQRAAVADESGNFAFALYQCSRPRQLTTGGGTRLAPQSADAFDGPRGDDRAVPLDNMQLERFSSLAAEWAEDAEPAPWVLQQAGGARSESAEHHVQMFLGVDVPDLLRQIGALRQEKRDLAREVESMQRWHAKVSTTGKVSCVIQHDVAETAAQRAAAAGRPEPPDLTEVGFRSPMSAARPNLRDQMANSEQMRARYAVQRPTSSPTPRATDVPPASGYFAG